MAQKLTTCTFCGVGCGLYLETSGNQIVCSYPSTSHPANAGKICVRGWHAHEVAGSPDRLKYPLLRRNGRFEEVGWDEALGFVATRLQEICGRHGPDAAAFLNSPRCSNEESYLLQKLARAVVGTNNVGHGTGVYGNNSIDVLLEMIGVPASTTSLADLAHSDVVVVDGIDLARRMPTIGGAVIRAKLRGAKLIVIGTRRHRIVEQADLFLQIMPGTEAVLFGAIAKIIDDRGLVNLPFIKAHCQNYEAFLNQVRQYDLLEAAERCGVPAHAIEQAALIYAEARAAALLYSTSMDDRSTASIQALVNLVLLTGNLGRPGAGIFALTEQNNLQGVCDMGMLPDRLPGYGTVTDPGARAAIESAWNVSLPRQPGLDARSVLGNRGQGKVKALWLGRYSPDDAACYADIGDLLDECELLVVQHLFMTDAAQHAHVVLPTTAFGEERVSFTSTERRIQLAERVIDPPEGLRPAWEQITELARRMGADWSYRSSDEVMDEIAAVIPFYSGVSYENLVRGYGRQWPCTKDRPLGTPFLFADGPESDFRFVPVTKPAHAASPPPEFPFTLIFGNSLYYWNQNVLVRHSETLKREFRILSLDYPDGFVEINTDDATRLGIRDGAPVRLSSAQASAVSAARVTPEVRPGTISVPYFVREVARRMLNPTTPTPGVAGTPLNPTTPTPGVAGTPLGGSECGSQVLPVRLEKEAR